ncbi:MAG: HlyD family efflux transporter periplasmic adaptor subunit [Micropepsaceae bacterium]
MRAAALCLVPLMLAACSPQGDDTLQGYGEAAYLYVAPQDGGVIASLSVKEGDRVEAGAVVATLDGARAGYQRDAAKAAAESARANVADDGALAEAVRQAEANRDLAAKTLKRTEELVATKAASRAKLDTDRAALKSAEAALAAAKAERDAAIRQLGSAEAELGLAERRLADLTLKAPASGTIERIYRRGGEVVAAGAPVLALLAPENMKVRFFVPEAQLAAMTPGAEVSISCDGCKAGLTARITWVASEPEFTPPVIYSLDERAKLVFLVEAAPSDPAAIRPGLPVDVKLK